MGGGERRRPRRATTPHGWGEGWREGGNGLGAAGQDPYSATTRPLRPPRRRAYLYRPMAAASDPSREIGGRRPAAAAAARGAAAAAAAGARDASDQRARATAEPAGKQNSRDTPGAVQKPRPAAASAAGDGSGTAKARPATRQAGGRQARPADDGRAAGGRRPPPPRFATKAAGRGGGRVPPSCGRPSSGGGTAVAVADADPARSRCVLCRERRQTRTVPST